MNAILLFLSGFLLAADLAADPTPVTNKELENFQKAWDKSPGYSANYDQKVYSKMMETTDETKGKLFVLRPDKLRWESETDGSIQLINGKELLLVQPKARKGKTVVNIYEDYKKSADVKLVDFLAGKLKLKSHFAPKLIKNDPKSVTIELKSKNKGQNETYIAEVDKKDYVLQSLVLETEDTKTTVNFSEVKANQKPDEKLFAYNPGPEDIVHKHK